ncbi:hypothetical protein RYZ26_19480 [Terasakiella sp. A23]|uniref:hypothetical protein n=1 Tax=Terasakiella sp. FCG-A23 TaxID=3080561 RepID=UPI0029558A88|nr:hypothetical protein [Terasakiella sp. A23]MDV7341791.1 hypothetical protein [Terasakiella sp. A23]
MKLIIYLSFVFLAFSETANASELPRYDVNGHCENVSKVSGGSNMIFNSCIDMEQKAYVNIKTTWSETPQKTQSHCDQVGKVSGGSYSILESCIKMEMRANKNKKKFEY